MFNSNKNNNIKTTFIPNNTPFDYVQKQTATNKYPDKNSVEETTMKKNIHNTKQFEMAANLRNMLKNNNFKK